MLRVLEEGAFRRVGGLKDLPLDVRIIAASNRDLKTESDAGNFRLDLYYRLSVIQIDIPPLRERGDDILILAEYYLNQFNQKLRKEIRGLSPEVSTIFRNYLWPGNVRELRNVIERVMILEDSEQITPMWLPRGMIEAEVELIQPTEEPVAQAPVLRELVIPVTPVPPTPFVVPPPIPFLLPENGVELEAVEMSLVKQALTRCHGNQTRAAELLGISRDQLRYRLKKLEEINEAPIEVVL